MQMHLAAATYSAFVVEAMNPTPLDTKSNIVANWKIFQQGERSIYQIIRANGADTVYMSFGAMLKDFTREDLIELYSMVKNVDSIGKFLMYLRFVQVFLDQQVGDMSTHDKIYVTPSHTNKVFGNMKRVGKGFFGNITTLFPTMMIQAHEEMGEGSENPIDPHHVVVPSAKKPWGIPLLKLVLALETTKTNQALEIDSLKRRVKNLEKKDNKRIHKLKRLYKVGLSDKVVSSDDEGLGEEDASKQGRKIHDIDSNEDITLAGTHFDANTDMFGVHDLDGDEVFIENVDALAIKKVEQSEKVIETEVAAAKNAKGIVFHDQEQAPTPTPIVSSQQPSQVKVQDKGKGKMVEEEPVKKFTKKDQLRLDKELAFKLQAEEEEESLKRAGDELEQEKAKKQKIDGDQEEVEMKNLIEIVPGEEEVAVDAITLATKPPSIIDWKIVKEGKISFFQIIRADGSSKRYSSFIQMLRDFDREDLETLWILVKAKHGSTRPEEGYERVI
ncbi:hypothetical protein Tco_0517941 [Tanacetum coccineum]